MGEHFIKQMFPVEWNSTINMFCRHVDRISIISIQNRHDRILDIIAKWISVNLKEEFELFVDLIGFFPTVGDDFRFSSSEYCDETGQSIITLELTICHESNIQSSKTYKLNKYRNLSRHLLPPIFKTPLKNYTIEVRPNFPIFLLF